MHTGAGLYSRRGTTYTAAAISTPLLHSILLRGLTTDTIRCLVYFREASGRKDMD
jgi:hypothetical protein